MCNQLLTSPTRSPSALPGLTRNELEPRLSVESVKQQLFTQRRKPLCYMPRRHLEEGFAKPFPIAGTVLMSASLPFTESKCACWRLLKIVHGQMMQEAQGKKRVLGARGFEFFP